MIFRCFDIKSLIAKFLSINHRLSAIDYRPSTIDRRGSLVSMCLLFTIYLSTTSVAQTLPVNEQHYNVKDLNSEWVVYDNQQKEYVPYLPEEHFNESAVSLIFDLESNRRYSLLLYTETGGHLFMNGSLREKLIPKQWRVFRVDSLYRAYKKPFLLLTLYGSTGIQTKNAFVGYAKNVADKLIMIEEGEESSLALRPRIKSSFNDFSVFSLMLLIGFVATLFGGYERPFRRMYSVLDLFTFDSRSDTFMVNKPFSRTNFLFLILNCGLIAYLYFFASNNSYNLFFSNQLINENQTFSQTLLPFLEITAILMALMLAKYTLLYLLGQLYKIGSITNLHFFRDIQSSVLFYSVVVILVSLISMYIPRWNQVEIKYIFIYPAITFYILRTLLLYFTISTNSDTKNLYLISYLCISEFIPLIIGVRYVL